MQLSSAWSYLSSRSCGGATLRLARGGWQRDASILPLIDPIVEKLGSGQEPAPEEVVAVAQKSFARPLLYEALKFYERLDLFPEHLKSRQAQAESALVYWMLHPNELQEAPESIELIDTIVRKLHGEDCEFYVFRYKMPDGHWAADDGWLLGLAGPFMSNDPPYFGVGAFSRCGDNDGDVEPAELVNWYIGMAFGKAASPDINRD